MLTYSDNTLKKHHMCAVNTHIKSGSGPTYFYYGGYRSRIDYLTIPKTYLADVVSVRRLENIGYFLQLSKCGENRDHVPLKMCVKHRGWYEAPEARVVVDRGLPWDSGGVPRLSGSCDIAWTVKARASMSVCGGACFIVVWTW